MQTTAQAFLIFELTKSQAYLGFIGFASGAPFWIFNLFGGVLSDRISRRKMLIVTQISMMILAFLMAYLTFGGMIQPWQIILLTFFTGIANSFDAPARMAFVPELVNNENLINAIALNSSFSHLAMVIGPALAGLVYAIYGPAWCFTINGISFLAVIFALCMMRLNSKSKNHRRATASHELREGISFVMKHPIIRILISLVMVVAMFGMAYVTLIPAWAVNILNGDSRTNGLLQSARALGAMLSALMIASLGSIKYKGKLLTLASIIFPIGVILWSLTNVLPLSLLLISIAGGGFMVLLIMANTLIQLTVSDHLRGRVMGLYTFAIFGLLPIGALLAGVTAQWLNEPITALIGGLATLFFGIMLYWKVPQLRELE